MVCQEGFFKSANGINNVKYYIRLPEVNPRAIVQIVHGMREFFERYNELSEYLCKKGFIVCGNDHLGHGQSVDNYDGLGFFAEKDGDLAVISDVGTLHDIMRKKYRSLPYIMVGHSFGSFVARAYAANHKEAIDGLVLSGTSGQKLPVKLAKKLCRFIGAFRGMRHRSKFVTALTFWGYNKRFKNDGNTGSEWITTDKDFLLKYAADKRCNFMFTLSAYYDMFSIIDYIQSDQWYDDMPEGLPLFVVAGEFDPISKCTEGLYEMMEKLSDSDVCNIEFKVYKGERHEPFTGITREEAYSDLSDWIDERIEGVVEARRQSYNAFTQKLNTDDEQKL